MGSAEGMIVYIYMCFHYLSGLLLWTFNVKAHCLIVGGSSTSNRWKKPPKINMRLCASDT